MPIKKTAKELRDIVSRVLVAAGADNANADRVAQALVSSDLSGVVTHGVLHLSNYVKGINDGHIIPNAKPETISETETSALVSGNWTFGFVSAMYGLEIAIRKAAEHNAAVVSIVQANHIGRLGEYAEVAAEQGMVSLVWSGGQGFEIPAVVPHGGSKPCTLSTNPISIGVPTGQGFPMVLDFATTAIAQSKAFVARNEGKLLPPNCILDKNGEPSRDPADLFDGGSLLPFGGHKGYAIMLADELLSRILSGADNYSEDARGGPFMRHQGVTFIVFKADLFQPMNSFKREADQLLSDIRSVPPAPGFDRVIVPGDLEEDSRSSQQIEGITVSDVVWADMKKVAGAVGIDIS